MKHTLTLMLLSPLMAAAITLGDKEVTMTQLESAFWDCDYASTQSALGFSEAAACSTIFEKLKSEKFGGEYSKLIEWWKSNKAREHTLRSKK